jgi:hypothetical protein
MYNKKNPLFLPLKASTVEVRQQTDLSSDDSSRTDSFNRNTVRYYSMRPMSTCRTNKTSTFSSTKAHRAPPPPPPPTMPRLRLGEDNLSNNLRVKTLFVCLFFLFVNDNCLVCV